ncbi:hypothetical protein CTAYLR_009072 [Chrysophaeum taylorii]|uniref:Uncharacterized protein n=1 Tax=Chrysophaeum taylorii TaxID=2483200 RepID=A0AAD7XQ52_9STRA|nr:hypothetical protein CTAYLR_009072 [Chrysophaeum taylorii]
MEAWRLGQTRRVRMRSDWEKVKASCMLRAVRAKFAQHDEAREELVATTGAIRAPPSTADWQVTNGLIIERIREEFRLTKGLYHATNATFRHLPKNR